jgi:hypothetical protein
MKRKIRTWIYQKVANFILSVLERCPETQVQFWFDAGMKLDAYCIETHDIYLE